MENKSIDADKKFYGTAFIKQDEEGKQNCDGIILNNFKNITGNLQTSISLENLEQVGGDLNDH